MFLRKPSQQIMFLLLTTALLLASCSPAAAPAPTLDVNAINTTIVGTTVAQFSIQFTQTAQAAPTSTPAPTETVAVLPTLALATSAELSPTAITLPTLQSNVLPTVGIVPAATQSGPTVAVPVLGYDCNKAQLVGKTIANGTVFAAGASITAGWQIQNTGSCTWSEGYTFTFLSEKSSGRIKGYSIAIKQIGDFTKPNHSQSFVVQLTAPAKAGSYKGYWQMQAGDGTLFGPVVSLEIVVN